MLLDGVGLCLIAGCTVLEGLDLWGDIFSAHAGKNQVAIAFWVGGRSLQVLGLFFLMAHAASFQVLPAIEVAGMALLTAGPVLNMCACSMFKTKAPNFFFNRAWMLTESIELLGISILDLSLCDAAHSVILLAEVVGFSILAMAALLQFEFSVATTLPKVSLRLDPIHVFDCLGLASLTVVAIVQYFIKESKHNSSHSPAPPPPAPPPPLPPASHRQQHHEDDKL